MTDHLPFSVVVGGARVEMPIERISSFGLDHLGYALGLPAMRWEHRCGTVVGTPLSADDADACLAWAAALRDNPTRLSRADGRVRIEISRCPEQGAGSDQPPGG